MTIVSAESGVPKQSLGGVPLARYANLLPISECAFWGVERDRDFHEEYAVWTLRERRMIAKYLDEAQEKIEDELGFSLNARWFEDEMIYSCPLVAERGRIIEAGIEAWEIVEADATVDKTDDPHEVTVTTTVTDEDEIVVAYPASLDVEDRVEINPSDIDISGGTATIYIPRCRTLKPEHVDNPTTGHDYETDTFFLDEVDVWRHYNDPSAHASLVWPHRVSDSIYPFCTANCDEYTRTGCIYIRNPEIGILDVLPANYDESDGWTACQNCYYKPERVHLYYKAGLNPITPSAESAIIRLAHTLMPRMPCGCEKFVLSWEEDNNIPDVMTRERVNNPFGIKDGAWAAWCYVVDMKIGRSSGICA